jgi:hypothetical protein
MSERNIHDEHDIKSNKMYHRVSGRFIIRKHEPGWFLRYFWALHRVNTNTSACSLHLLQDYYVPDQTKVQVYTFVFVS